MNLKQQHHVVPHVENKNIPGKELCFMFCVKCGAKLEDGANFCTRCGARCGNGAASGKLPETMASEGTEGGVAPIGTMQTPGNFEATSPLRFLSKLIGAVVVILLLYLWLRILLYYNLSGRYETYDYFPVEAIEFVENGSFTAEVSEAHVIGKYKKQSIGSKTYTLTVTDYESVEDYENDDDGVNPVLVVQAYEFIRNYEMIAEENGEGVLEIVLIPKPGHIDYASWTGTVAIFNKNTDDTSSGY